MLVGRFHLFRRGLIFAAFCDIFDAFFIIFALLEYSFMVKLEALVSSKFGDERTFQHNLFLYHLNCRTEVITTYIVAFIYLGNRFTMFEVTTRPLFCRSLIRSAGLGDQVSVLRKETMKHGPTTATTFVQVIAIRQLLWR